MATPENGVTTVIRPVGTFDVAEALRVVETLAQSKENSEVYVDLTRVRHFDDRAVAVLGSGLTRARGHISVQGLLRHHYRMMRYLGVTSAALDWALPQPDLSEA